MTAKIEKDKEVEKEKERSYSKSRLDVEQMLKDNKKYNKV